MNKRAQTYSAEAFAGIFKKYWGKVYAICYQYTRDADVAKDMVQNIFITLWERGQVLQDEESLEKYLSRAAKYQVFKKNRDSRSDLVDALDGRYDEVSGLEDNDPHQRYIYRELAVKLDQQIALLNEPAKTIFMLSHYDALSYKEIAARMGIAVKTVEYHLTRAKKIIRANIG
ncbi:RNA polymerase sigma factor [Niabella aquatica]